MILKNVLKKIYPNHKKLSKTVNDFTFKMEFKKYNFETQKLMQF